MIKHMIGTHTLALHLRLSCHTSFVHEWGGWVLKGGMEQLSIYCRRKWVNKGLWRKQIPCELCLYTCSRVWLVLSLVTTCLGLTSMVISLRGVWIQDIWDLIQFVWRERVSGRGNSSMFGMSILTFLHVTKGLRFMSRVIPRKGTRYSGL